MNRDDCRTRWGSQFRSKEKSRPGMVERSGKKETKDCGEVGNDKNKQKDWIETTDGCVNWDIRNPRGEKDKREARETEDVRENKV